MKTNTQTTGTTNQTITAYSKMIEMFDKLHNFLDEWRLDLDELRKLDTLDPHDLVDCSTTPEEYNTYVFVAQKELQMTKVLDSLYGDLLRVDWEMDKAVQCHSDLLHPQNIEDDWEEDDLPF